ncbi:nitroreductase family protein [Streptomyces sp. NPDC053069]|uniref:nitroreductase family protein n=1 Tax=Streptomyces sp. NPDC053069 TaxID=3365695 RepID=UPI0037CFAAF0
MLERVLSAAAWAPSGSTSSRGVLMCGQERYSALGIAREDWEARQRAASANGDCFGAPAALFCYIDRDMGRPQWSDVGMYLQTVMLLLRSEGLHSCPQMAWSVYRETVAEILSPPDELIFFCGMSIGFEDVTVEYRHTGRHRSTRPSHSSKVRISTLRPSSRCTPLGADGNSRV